MCYIYYSPTSDGAGCAVLASAEFVARHGLEQQAVEIVAQVMSTDLPSTFKEKSCIKVVRILQTHTQTDIHTHKHTHTSTHTGTHAQTDTHRQTHANTHRNTHTVVYGSQCVKIVESTFHDILNNFLN